MNQDTPIYRVHLWLSPCLKCKLHYPFAPQRFRSLKLTLMSLPSYFLQEISHSFPLVASPRKEFRVFFISCSYQPKYSFSLSLVRSVVTSRSLTVGQFTEWRMKYPPPFILANIQSLIPFETPLVEPEMETPRVDSKISFLCINWYLK